MVTLLDHLTFLNGFVECYQTFQFYSSWSFLNSYGHVKRWLTALHQSSPPTCCFSAGERQNKMMTFSRSVSNVYFNQDIACRESCSYVHLLYLVSLTESNGVDCCCWTIKSQLLLSGCITALCSYWPTALKETNEAEISPNVQTCRRICFRPPQYSSSEDHRNTSTVFCIFIRIFENLTANTKKIPAWN